MRVEVFIDNISDQQLRELDKEYYKIESEIADGEIPTEDDKAKAKVKFIKALRKSGY